MTYMNRHRYMLGVDLGDTIRYDPDLVEVFEQTICLIAVSGINELPYT